MEVKINPLVLEHNDVKPNFDFKNFVKRLSEATGAKEVASLLLGLHQKFWHAPVPDMTRFLKGGGCFTDLVKKIVVITLYPRSVLDVVNSEGLYYTNP